MSSEKHKKNMSICVLWVQDYLRYVEFEKKGMCLPGIEPGTFCVLDRCDNHYTISTCPTVV